jgi:solute:Na+ symporter, SSS family
VIAVGLPTPHTSMSVRDENGAIIHQISVVPHAVELGLGLVPARTDSIADPTTGNVLKDAGGHPLIDYGMATPSLLPHNLPTGLLGLGLAALLACLAGGLASRIAAVNTVFVYDVYEPLARRRRSEKHLLGVSRLTTLVAVIVSCGLAWGALRVHTMPDVMDLLAVLLAVVFAPMLGTFVLGVLWKRATGCGAFAGLLAGFIAALVHWGRTLPEGYARGFAGGWLGSAHHVASMLTQNAGTAAIAIVANVLATVVFSFVTTRKTETQLGALMYTASPSKDKLWWRRPAGTAGLILLVSLAVCLLFV